MCGQQFSHGEARLQQWFNRNTQRACVHAHCVNGGVHHDHELHPKQPLDQEAVELVARQRECVIRAAADTEVLLPFASSLLCCPCLDVKKLSAWTKKSWTSSGSTTSRGTASRTCVARRTFNPRHGSSLRYNRRNMAILRAIVHHDPSSLASEPTWKALVLSSWLLLG